MRSMALTIFSTTFDADDPAVLAAFWGEVFEGSTVDTSNEFLATLTRPDGGLMMFIKVEEDKSAKNRCHLDLHADSEAQVDAEVQRLAAVGAKVGGTFREYGAYWTTIQDPEGNELCIGCLVPDA